MTLLIEFQIIRQDKMKIVIITEGSSKIGFGHITRCTSIYQAFKVNGLKPNFIVNGDSSVESILKNTKYEIFDWLEYPEKLYKSLKGSSIIIIDSYLADKGLYERIAQFSSVNIYIDDNNRINYPKGILVNGSIHAEKLDYLFSNEIDYLLGSQFIPLRRQFWNIPDKEVNPTLQNVMITFGGDDLRNLTPKILKILNENYPSLNKKIVIGSGFNNVSDIEKLKDEKTELIYYPHADGMLNTMLESDITISAGGQTLYELARVGVPTIAISVAHNQTHNVENWQKVGFIELAGYWDDENLLKNILDKLELLKDRKIRLEKKNIGQEAVDGKGALKIAKYSLNRYYSNKITLRPAMYRDVRNIFELSNDNDVRENSFNHSKIRFEDHEKWFKSKIEDENNIFLVVNIQDNFAGQVRFELEGDSATVSISIKEEFRELGLGKNFLKKAIDYLKVNSPQISMVNAYIKDNNPSSLKLFEKMDFEFNKILFIKNQKAFEFTYMMGD